MDYDKIVDQLSLEDLAGQVLCYDISWKDDVKEVEKVLRKIRPGGLFLTNTTKERISEYTKIVNSCAKIPVIISSDIENGPETAIKDSGRYPHSMALGACDDVDLVKKIGSVTAKICRKNGVHWTYSPVVDINYKFQNPECNIRGISDDPDHVIKIASAFIDGSEEDGYLITTCKHFPGQGMDDRNSHFVSTINPMSKEEWFDTYGRVYKSMIAKGISSIMVGHGSLPAFEDDFDPILGAPPAVLSYNLMTKLLKEELGFEGCIVSDAMSMIGVATRVDDLSELAVSFLNAGGDMILFPEPTDYDNIIKAVKDGVLPIERLKDAVKRVLKLKDKARLFEDQTAIDNEIEDDLTIDLLAQEIADKSIKIVRDLKGIIPANLKKGDKILFANIVEPRYNVPPTGHEFDPFKDEFEKNGMIVDVYTNIGHRKVQEIMNDYKLILINSNFCTETYHGATMRIGWNNIHVFWRGYVLAHPKVIFVSFGDPYKLYDVPYMKEYINAFSNSPASQRAVARVILGQIKATGKNPISFPPFFDREV